MKMADEQSAESDRIRCTLLGQTTAYCEQVITGSKLCAQLLCLNEHLPFVKGIIEQEKCRTFHKAISAEASAVFIYKYDFVRLIINELLIDDRKATPTAFRVWATGKLFGYSDFEISKYLEAHGYLDDV
jgi:hypothetical protein